MISRELKKEINAARAFGEKLERIVIGKQTFPSGTRINLVVAHWSLSNEHHKAILSLEESELSGSAVALLRPIVEASVRAHVVFRGSEEDLTLIQRDKYTVKFKEIGPWIDAEFGLESAMEDFLNTASNVLHSYTHSGAMQLGRRLDGNIIKPNYRDSEIIEVINVATSSIYMVTKLVVAVFGYDGDARRVDQLFIEWAKH
jgi:hypothetical protein